MLNFKWADVVDSGGACWPCLHEPRCFCVSLILNVSPIFIFPLKKCRSAQTHFHPGLMFPDTRMLLCVPPLKNADNYALQRSSLHIPLVTRKKNPPVIEREEKMANETLISSNSLKEKIGVFPKRLNYMRFIRKTKPLRLKSPWDKRKKD